MTATPPSDSTDLPPRTALVTGVNGFVGSHLAEYLLAHGCTVVGTVRSFRSDQGHLRKAREAAPHHFSTVFADVTDAGAMAALVRQVRPAYVFHLAAQSFVPHSWASPRQTLDANVVGTLNVLEAVRHEAPEARVQIAGSSEEYGRVEPHECPITEAQPLRPLSPYGVSKVAADLLAQQYAASYGLRVVVTRAFNHTGARRGAAFAESDWARQVARIEAGKQEPLIRHGNLAAVRDLTHVVDVVRGYRLAAEHGDRGAAYNLCSGADHAPTMEQVLDTLCAWAKVVGGIRAWAEPSRLRPSDVPRLVGSATRAREALGWEPQRDWVGALRELLEYWRVVEESPHAAPKT